MTPNCPLCGSSVAPHESLGELGFVRCDACTFIHKPSLAAADLHEEYEGGTYETRQAQGEYVDDGLLEQRRENARPRVAFVKESVTGGRLLDVGAAGGAFVLEAGLAGFQASGIEPAPAFAAYARDTLHVDVRSGRAEDLTEADGPYDAITMWHVLEHVADPVAVLGLLARRLASGGAIVLEVPNVASVVARRMGTAWPHLDPEVHVSQFTPATLRIAAERAGLRPVTLGTVSHSVYLPPRERLRPGPLGERALLLRRRGVLALRHPDAHELLRLTAVRA